MKELQSSVWTKVLAAVLLLSCAYGAGTAGVDALLALDNKMARHWQDSGKYWDLVYDRRQEIVDGVFDDACLEDLQAQMEDGSAGPLAYVDVKAIQDRQKALEERMDPANTWFRFTLKDKDGNVVTTNLSKGEQLADVVHGVHYDTIRVDGDGSTTYPVDEGLAEEWAGDQGAATAEPGEDAQTLVIEYGVPDQVTAKIPDEFFEAYVAWSNDQKAFDVHLTTCLNLLAGSLLGLILLLWTAGHKKGVEGIHTTWQEKIFFDLYAAAMAALAVCLVVSAVMVGENMYYRVGLYSGHPPQVDVQTYKRLVTVGLSTISACFMAVCALTLRTLTVRLKARCLGRTTLFVRVVTWTVRTVHEFLRFLPFTWKLVLGFGIYSAFILLLFLMCQYAGGTFALIFFLVQLVLLLLLSWWAYGYHRLRQGTKTIAAGDLDHQIDTARMPFDLKEQAEDLNNISVGLSSAVDEKMRSERFKAELITNVSHDLKTPLTSIINYVDLLKTTDQPDPRAQEYIEVLDRKSQRLKKLTEDLVEASKASTGVLAVEREKIGMTQLIGQALGEWEEKLQAHSLSLVTNLPEGETWVYADGRHLWRVIDNLLSNCAKYAMEGTRIYLDLVRGKGQVVLSVKNISRDPLNVPPERLMERFVRGEESRTTEGSGLGLSIARSLTELQGGEFALTVDGDLFKATVTLAQAG